MLPSEMNDQLRLATDAEHARQIASRNQRTNLAQRQADAVVAQPPRADELRRACLFVDRAVRLPDGWDAAVAHAEARVVQSPFEATFLICDNPWSPRDDVITWFAALTGRWIITPAVVVANHGKQASGATLKFHSALMSKRFVWVSQAARSAHAAIWRCILEAMTRVDGHKWVLLHSARAFATEKSKAEKQKRSPQVLAFCAPSEGGRSAHVFTKDNFLSFVRKQDAARTSLGIAGM